MPDEALDLLGGGFRYVVDTLGVPMTWMQTKPPQASASMKAGAKIVGRNDVEYVNAIGIGGRIITADATSFGGDQPEKFDVFEIAGKSYVANSVHEVFINDNLVGWKILARAQQ